MNINPGKLNRRIIIQKRIIAADNLGNEISTWEDWRTLWAGVNSLFGKEYWAAAEVGQEDTMVFTVRWSPALDALLSEKEITRCRILFRGGVYAVKDYDNPGYSNRLVKIRAVNRRGED